MQQAANQFLFFLCALSGSVIGVIKALHTCPPKAFTFPYYLTWALVKIFSLGSSPGGIAGPASYY